MTTVDWMQKHDSLCDRWPNRSMSFLLRSTIQRDEDELQDRTEEKNFPCSPLNRKQLHNSESLNQTIDSYVFYMSAPIHLHTLSR